MRSGLLTLRSACAAALSLIVIGGALAASAWSAPVTPTVSAACNQDVAPGHFACMALRRHAHFSPNTIGPAGLGPADIKSAYALPNVGTGQTVWVVDAFDDPNAESDLGVYRAQYGLPLCTTANGCFAKLNQSGAAGSYPSADPNWSTEISLDLAMVSATCPLCNIRLVEANDAGDGLFAAIHTAITMGAKFISLSWGGSESGSESYYDQFLAAPGVVITASTGDNGYADGVAYPSTSPYVVAVGGTSLTKAANVRGWNETAWSFTQSYGGGGSGCSSDELQPSWQSSVTALTQACARRAVADVSAVGDPATGVAVYQTYGGSGWEQLGGTSASSPIIASVYALAGTPGSTQRPARYPYAAPAGSLNDVVSGSTGSCAGASFALCNSGTGWDGPTGLGTPNGVAAFAPSPSAVSVTPIGAQSALVGVPAKLTVKGTDVDGGAVTYSATGLPPGLAINASTGAVSGTPTAAGSYPVTVTATNASAVQGSASFTWTVSNAVCTAQLLRNTQFEAGVATPWAVTPGVYVTATGTWVHSPKHIAKLDGYGKAHVDTVSQTISIPAGCKATMTYWVRISTTDASSRPHDTLTIGTNNTSRVQYSNLNKTASFVSHHLDMSMYAGKSVTIVFKGVEDGSYATAFRLDDVTVQLSPLG